RCDTRAVVLDDYLERQRYALRNALHRNADSGAEGGRELYLWFLRVTKGFRRVLHEVEEDLDELVAVAIDRRQRRIILLREGDAPRHAVARQQLHPVEHDVDVEWLAVERPVVA